MPTSNALIDDRLLVARLLDTRVRLPRTGLCSTTYWYFRACRAAAAGGGGQLSGPFAALPADEQAVAIRALLTLPDDIELPGPRTLVPAMVAMHERHPLLNAMNLEAVAAAAVFGARVLLSAPAARGVLPAVLDTEKIPWRVVGIG